MQQAGNDTATVLRVLLVDASAVLRGHVRVALEDAGLTVVADGADGAYALTQAATQDPDVVLVDLRMPRMDGIQAARALREQQPQTRMVLWTGEDHAHLAGAPSASPARTPALPRASAWSNWLPPYGESARGVHARGGTDARGWICGPRTDRPKRRYQQSASPGRQSLGSHFP